MFNRILATPTYETPKGTLEAYELGDAASLLRKSVPGAGLEIHHVAHKHSALLSIPGYEADTAPAMALPKGEHRRILPALDGTR